MRPLDDCIAHWKQQAVKQVNVDVDIRDRAAREARKLAGVLARIYSAKKVYLFGSLARRDTRFANTSDIDLVVEGLPPDCFYEAIGRPFDSK